MYLVIDVGGTYTKYGYYDKTGHCLLKDKYKTITTNIEDFYNKMTSLVNQNTDGIAISMPGLLDSKTGIVHAITLLPFLKGHNLIKELHEKTNLPISIENDAKCAALGEMWQGNLQHMTNGLFMVLGSGIGGTLIINGDIVKSPRFKAGEIGSILMPLDKEYSQMTNFGANNNANILIKKISQEIDCKEDGITVFEQIQNNPQAKTIFSKYCRQIAFMIYNLDYILDLDVVVIGGGISEQSILIETIKEEYKILREKYEEDTHPTMITNCRHHNEANLLGALYHHLKNGHSS
ncbi:MAG: ROK family protein [Bacilli bacterium]|nr:ROK family protein [Bacilli bacterium]